MYLPHMKTQSAGILLYRPKNGHTEVLLVHPGGPFWAKKDAGTWSIPKGEFTDDEDPLTAAKREFEEETGTAVDGNFVPLAPIRQKSGKRVYVWALEHDLDNSRIQSNTFEMEWPPKSGRMQTYPEVDRAEWFDLAAARQKINPAQAAFLDELTEIITEKRP